MAGKLQCEICGGKLIGMPGGVFECDSCGMEYSTAWAKEKIQEIRGTVKVEGTVEVTGKVQIDGPVTVENQVDKDTLLRRGMMALEDHEWERAKTYFNQVLDIDVECADAYFGLAMSDAETSDKNSYGKRYIGTAHRSLSTNKNILRARQCGKELNKWLNELDTQVVEPQLSLIITDKCIGCTKCARDCPVNAITGSVRRQHVIDVFKCTLCGICKSHCPVGAIKEEFN